MSRGFYLLLVLLAFSAGCSGPRAPAEVVESAIQSAQAGRLDEFLDHFEPRSKAMLGMFWAVSGRYGYLDDESLRFLSSGEVEEVSLEGDRAIVRLSHANRSGPICLRLVDNNWRIDLLGACCELDFVAGRAMHNTFLGHKESAP